jgi:hypothetical protein
LERGRAYECWRQVRAGATAARSGRRRDYSRTLKRLVLEKVRSIRRHPRCSATAGGTRVERAGRVPTASIGQICLPIATAAAVSALFGTIAADARWLAAVGGYVVGHGSIPDFVPYASAPSQGWADVPVLAELAFHAFETLGGDRGLLVAQVVAVTAAFGVLAVDMRRAGPPARGALIVLFLLIPATFTALPLVRAQVFSLVLFPLVVLLVRGEARRPSRRVWLLPPLLALWSNLHGAVLVGLAVVAAYLLLERSRHELAAALGALTLSVLALFVTPALWRSGNYYAGILENEAARRGFGLWAPLSLTSGFDLAFVICALVLGAAVIYRRPQFWEVAALAGLAVLTARVARGGVWFAFFAATPATFAFGRGAGLRARLAFPASLLFIGLSGLGLIRGPHSSGAGGILLGHALTLAGGTPVLATDLLAEQVAMAGGRIWVGNPIDAFRRNDQRRYLDWLQGRPAGDGALREAPRVVLVRPGSPPEHRLARSGIFRAVARDDGVVIYVRSARRG